MNVIPSLRQYEYEVRQLCVLLGAAYKTAPAFLKPQILHALEQWHRPMVFKFKEQEDGSILMEAGEWY
jgi:hypothetical protein